ncbi:hypothetical protein ACI6Q2_19095 [Chitinophagaceae bacterium LWZ2-11]
MRYLFMGVIAPSFVLFPIIAAFFKYQVIKKEFKIFFYYLVLTALINGVSIYLAKRHIANLPLLHANTIIEAIILLYFFKLVFQGKAITKWIIGLMIAFPVFCCINFIFFQSIHSFNTYSRPIEAVMFIVLCMMYYWYQDENEQTVSWANNPLNWLISGLLLYFASEFLLFISSNYLLTHFSIRVNEIIWNIHASFLIIMYILFAIGFIKCKPKE